MKRKRVSILVISIMMLFSCTSTSSSINVSSSITTSSSISSRGDSDSTGISDNSSISSSEIVPTGIHIMLDPGQSQYLEVGSSMYLPVYREPHGNTAEITGALSNSTICSESNYMIYALAVGKCDVTYSYADYPEISDTITITVVSVGSFRIVLLDGVDQTFIVGEECQFSTMLGDDIVPCFWWSSDEEILMVTNSGYITALQVGQATVTAWYITFGDTLEINIIDS